MTPTPDDLPSAGGRTLSQRSLRAPGSLTRATKANSVQRASASRLARQGALGAARAPQPEHLPMQSLVASAKRLTSKNLKGGTFKKTTAQGWQEDGWEMFDLVGEQHFLGTTLANQASKARFYVGVLPEGGRATTDVPDPTEDPQLQRVLEDIGGGPVGFAQMIQRMCVNLWVAGDGWLVGIPKIMLPDWRDENPEVDDDAYEEMVARIEAAMADDESDVALSDVEWRMMSVSEVLLQRDGLVTLLLGAEESERVTSSPDNLFMIRVWRPHPRRWWEADSPTRASLPVLRELVGLTMHISAQVDSRLAGAGILVVPASASRAMKLAAGLSEDSQEDPFTDALIEAMLTPIGDRANASALVPLVVTVPDEAAGKFDFITFAKPLDTEARNLRDEAIRRLALGQDAPPELLLGTGGMNHWGAWLVRDDVVTTHIEPPLALIADAITQQFLRPMMLEMGYTREQAKQHVIWYDVSDMVTRPNHAADALTLYDRDALSDEALREATGFDESDAPETSKMSLAAQTAFAMVKENPSLMANPGLPELVNQLNALISGNPVTLPKKVKDEGKAQVPTTATNPQAQQQVDGQPSPAQPKAVTGTPPVNPSVNQDPATARPNATAAQDVSAYRVKGMDLSPRDVYEAFGRDPEGHNILALSLVGEPIDVVQALAEDMRRSGADGPFVEGFLRAAEQQRMVKLGTEDDEGDNASALVGASNGAIVVLIPAAGDPINESVCTGFDAHMTLAYLGEDHTEIDPDDLSVVTSEVQEIARSFAGIELEVQRVDALGDSVAAFLVQSGRLDALRAKLMDNTVTADLDAVSNTHHDEEFIAHVSLAYDLDEDEDWPTVQQGTVHFDRIGVWLGDDHYDFPLSGENSSLGALARGGTVDGGPVHIVINHAPPPEAGLGFVRADAYPSRIPN